MSHKLNNPCCSCGKANPDLVNEFEYGCGKPCRKAKKFYKRVGKRLDELLDKVRELLNRRANDEQAD